MLDPRHRGAHEYIGETYLLAGDVNGAEKHLAALKEICLLPCQTALRISSVGPVTAILRRIANLNMCRKSASRCPMSGHAVDSERGDGLLIGL